MVNNLMPKYSGNPKELDESERTSNKYVNPSTTGCSNAQRQRSCLAMLPHCVLANVQKELDNQMEDSKISTCNGMWRAFHKEEVADLWHHAKHRFKGVCLRT